MSVAGHVGATFILGQLVDPLTVHLDDGKADETGQRFEPTREMQTCAHIGSKELIAVHVGMVMPTGAVGAGVTGEWILATGDQRIQVKFEPEFD